MPSSVSGRRCGKAAKSCRPAAPRASAGSRALRTESAFALIAPYLFVALKRVYLESYGWTLLKGALFYY
jgi:hypothetical protein